MAEFNLTKVITDAKELRWEIHKNPELGNEEIFTTERLRNFFESRGIRFSRIRGLNGGYVLIDAAAEKTVCFRADIDALAIKENTGLENSSQVDGVMHACGHDMHTAIAAALALVLQENKLNLKHNVVVLFQPAEECNPTGGAKRVIKSGFIESLKICEMYGLHVWPSYSVGKIGVRCGALMGSSDKMKIEITGKSSHAAEPHNGIDAISIAADTINAIVHKLRREIDPFDVSLVTIGAVNSSGRYNVLCDRVVLEGTTRASSKIARDTYHRRIKELSEGIAKSYGGEATIEIADGYHIVNNDYEQTQRFIDFSMEYLGKENVDTNLNTSLIGEDFSFFTEKVSSTYFFLGCESHYPLHSDKFCPKEETLDVAVKMLTAFFCK